MGEEVRQVVAEMGYERAQDLVGPQRPARAGAREAAIDLHEMIRPLEEMLDLEPIDMPVSAEEEREAAGLIVAQPIRMEAKQASHEIAALATEVCGGPVSIGTAASPQADSRWRHDASGGARLARVPRPVDANDRVLGTELAGALAGADLPARRRPAVDHGAGRRPPLQRRLDRRLGPGGVQRLGRRHRVEGGAQDGVGKTMFGGTIAILKGRNRAGERVNGSVGKSFAYGAQRGRFFVQGSADSRFCIRLVGADVVIGGEPQEPIRDDLAASPTARTSRASRSST